MLQPEIAILDELDSGLDIDALRACAGGSRPRPTSENLGVLAITHYSRLLHELPGRRVHILVKGRIVRSGDASLAAELEAEGYAPYLD